MTSFRYTLFVVMAVSVLLLNSAAQARRLGTDCEAEKTKIADDCAEKIEAAVARYSGECDPTGDTPNLKVTFDGGAHCCPPRDFVNATEEEQMFTFKEWECEPIDAPVDEAGDEATSDCEAETRQEYEICANAHLAAVADFKTACNHPKLKVMFNGDAHCCPPIDFKEVDEHEQVFTFKEDDCVPVPIS
eukprot:scaffold4001_cov67-Attheya_sp.AAC.7